MKISDGLSRSMACCLALLLASQCAGAAPSPQQEAAPSAQSQTAAASGSQELQTADAALPQDPVPNAATQSAQTEASQTTTQQHPNPPAQPVGTAVAPSENPTGVTASRPAGAVIAPGKQRRERSILIRVGIIVGAAVAVGTVVALSRTSSGRP